MNHTRKICAIALISFFASGCASIVSKSNYPVSITSTPSAASFTITNRSGQQISSGTTPQTLTLKSSAGFFKVESYNIAFSKEGFADQNYVLKSTVDGWYIGNVLLGGLLGMLIVDPATGAMYKLQDSVSVNMSEQTAYRPTNNPNELTIADISSLSDTQKAGLIALK